MWAVVLAVQSNLSYPGTLGLGGARNSDLSVSHKYIGCNRPHPLYCPQFLQCQHTIGQICCLVEGGARILIRGSTVCCSLIGSDRENVGS